MAKQKTNKTPHVADIEHAVETEFNLDHEAQLLAGRQRKKITWLNNIGWLPGNHTEPEPLVALMERVRGLIGPGEPHTQDTLQQIIGPAVYYDALEILDNTGTSPPLAHTELRKLALAVANCGVKINRFGHRVRVWGAITFDGPPAPVPKEERGVGFAPRMAVIVIRTYLGLGFCMPHEMAWVLMAVAEEVKDIWQQVRLTAAYKKGALSMVNIADYND